MTIYYQHIGERLSERDFPKSLGTPVDGLKRFTFGQIEDFLTHLSPFELAEIRRKTRQLTPTGFQIWGLPSGAHTVLKRMRSGDYLLLLVSVDFQYCGQVIHKISNECFDLSGHVWGEVRFPIIVLLQGELISYDWEDFLSDFDFNPRYHVRGHTISLAANRLAYSRFENER